MKIILIWVLLVNWGNHYNGAAATVEFVSKDRCVAAALEMRARPGVLDAYCIPADRPAP